jgi:hypothetical protein
MMKLMQCRPSQLLGIEEAHPAWCVDEAVYLFGMGIETDLESITNKNPKTAERRRRDRLMFLLDVPDTERFRPLGPPPGR